MVGADTSLNWDLRVKTYLRPASSSVFSFKFVWHNITDSCKRKPPFRPSKMFWNIHLVFLSYSNTRQRVRSMTQWLALPKNHFYVFWGHLNIIWTSYDLLGRVKGHTHPQCTVKSLWSEVRGSGSGEWNDTIRNNFPYHDLISSALATSQLSCVQVVKYAQKEIWTFCRVLSFTPSGAAQSSLLFVCQKNGA